MKNLGRTYEKLMTTLHVSYENVKICDKWCHSGNPLSEAVAGRILWTKSNWQPEWRFPKNAYKKWLTNFL